MNAVQQYILNPTYIFRLLHNGRQLLVITDEHKFFDGRRIILLCTKQTYQMRLQYL